MLNNYFNKIMICFIIILFSFNAYGLIISEVMFNPSFNENYNEWVEIYNENNYSVNVTELLICNDSIISGYLNKTSKNISYSNNYIINNNSFFIITDGGSGSDVLEHYNFSNNISIFHTSVSSICGGLSNSGENISVKLNYNTSFDYTNFSNIKEGFAPYYNFENKNYNFGCELHGTFNFYKACNDSSNQTFLSDELIYDFSISNDTLFNNSKLFFYGNISNPFNESKANLTIKIGVKTSEGFEYLSDLILFEKEFILKKGITSLNEIINNLSWIANNNLLSGKYKVYSRLKTINGEKRPSKTFFLYNKANVFLTNFIINQSNISLNDKIKLSFNISNEEIKDYNVSYGFKINNFQTIYGKNNYIYWCNKSIIKNNSVNIFDCFWNDTNNFISNNQSFSFYPLIKFEYENNEITREGDKVSVLFNGLSDLGESNFEIVNYQKCSFGKFSNVLIKFNSNNYNHRLRFIVYGYPKQIISNYNFLSVKANDYDSNSNVQIETLRNVSYYITIPFFIKPNCDNYYSFDNYRLRIRAFKDENYSWNELITKDFNININEKNSYFCPVSTKEKKLSKSNNLDFINNKISDDSSFTYGNVKFNIIMPKSINQTTFQILVNTSNKNSNYSSNFSIESYIYSGKKLSNDNKKRIILKPYENATILLNNVIVNELNNDKKYKIILKINSSIRKTIKSYSKSVIINLNNGINKINRIESFYSLDSKFNDKINFFAKTKNNEGFFELISEFGTKTIEINNKTKFEEKINPGLNYYFLLLKKDNKTIDVKTLRVLANQTSIKTLNYSESINVGLDNFNKYNKNNMLITSNVVNPIIYDFGKTKLKKLINYLLVFIIIISSIYLWRRLL